MTTNHPRGWTGNVMYREHTSLPPMRRFEIEFSEYANGIRMCRDGIKRMTPEVADAYIRFLKQRYRYSDEAAEAARAIVTSEEQEETSMSAPISPQQAADNAIVEQVVVQGDLSKLTPAQRVIYYRAVCDSLGLNPLTKPFDYITLNGKLQLYARKDATEQLRKKHSISVTKVEREVIEGAYTVTVYVRDRDGREDLDTGCVTIAGLKGDALCNAMMKAITKGKRRATLSICGLGMLDESEIETIEDARLPHGEDVAYPEQAPALTHKAPNGTTPDATRTITKDQWSEIGSLLRQHDSDHLLLFGALRVKSGGEIPVMHLEAIKRDIAAGKYRPRCGMARLKRLRELQHALDYNDTQMLGYVKEYFPTITSLEYLEPEQADTAIKAFEDYQKMQATNAQG